MLDELMAAVEQIKERGVGSFVEQYGIMKELPSVASDDVPYNNVMRVATATGQYWDFNSGRSRESLESLSSCIGVYLPAEPTKQDEIEIVALFDMVTCVMGVEREVSGIAWQDIDDGVVLGSSINGLPKFVYAAANDGLSVIMRPESHWLVRNRFRFYPDPEDIIIDYDIEEEKIGEHLFRSSVYALDMQSATCEYLDFRNIDLDRFPYHRPDYEDDGHEQYSFITDDGKYLWSVQRDLWDYQLRCKTVQRIMMDFSKARRATFAYDPLEGLR